MWMLTIIELSNILRGERLEGGHRKVDRGGVLTGRAIVSHLNINRLALPGNPDHLTAVLGFGTGVSIGTVVEGSDEVAIRVRVTTGTSVTILSEPGSTEIGVR